LTYFDVSSFEAAVGEVVTALRAANSPLKDIVATLVTNNAVAFSKNAKPTATSGTTTSASAGINASPSSTAMNIVSGSSSSPPSHSTSTSKGSDASSGSDSESMTGGKSAGSRTSTPLKSRDLRLRSTSGSTDGIVASGSNSSLGMTVVPPSSAVIRPRPKSPTLPPITFTSNLQQLQQQQQQGGIPTSYGSMSLTGNELPDVEILANQMALADWTIFSQCVIVDFMNASFLPKHKPSSPTSSTSEKTTETKIMPVNNSVTRYIDHTNMTTRWIATKILNVNSPRSRGKLLAYFIRLMEVLKDRQDYTGMINVFTTLNTNSIWKLRKSWKYVDSKRSKSFAKFEAIIKPMANFAGYRELLSKSKPPAVSALAILTKDLVAIEEQPTFVEDDDGNATNFLNWIKFSQLASVLSEQFLRLTKSGYAIEAAHGLFDELLKPNLIEIPNHRDSKDSSSGSNSNTTIPFLMTEDEIGETADRIDMEEQGLAQISQASSSSPPTSHAGSPVSIDKHSPISSDKHSSANAVHSGLLHPSGKRPSALFIYLQYVGQSHLSASSPAIKRSASPPPTHLAASLAATKEKMAQIQGIPSPFLTLDDTLEHVASVLILRRVITNSLWTSHLVTESLTESQKKSFENQHVIFQRDCCVRMLRLIDACVNRANSVTFGACNPGLLKDVSSVGVTTKSKTQNVERSSSLPLGASEIWNMKPLESVSPAFIGELDTLELVNPHTHLMEVLAESVRMFQKFDGVTKFRNLMRPNQLHSASGIGESLLLENRGVLAEMNIASRTLINAFLSASSLHFANMCQTSSNISNTSTGGPNLFFGCATSIDRVGISLQISVSNNESSLPKGLMTMPSSDGVAAGKSAVPRLLSLLPPAIAELFLPFESIISYTTSSIAWFSKSPEKDGLTTLSKKDKHSPPSTSRPTDDDGFQIGYSGMPANQEGVLVLSIALPLGSYASTLTHVSPSQKRYLASKLTVLAVNQWKVEHVVTWLYLTGMAMWCSKFEQQSVSGSELCDLDAADLSDMGVKAPPSQSATVLIKNIKSLVNVAVWDGVIVGETSTESHGTAHFSLPDFLTPSSSSSSIHDLKLGSSDDSSTGHEGATGGGWKEDWSDSSEISREEDQSDSLLGYGSGQLSRRKSKHRNGSDSGSMRSASPLPSHRGGSLALGAGSSSSPSSPPTGLLSASGSFSYDTVSVKKKRRNSSSRQSPSISPPILSSPMSATSTGMGGGGSGSSSSLSSGLNTTRSRGSPKPTMARLRVLDGMKSGIIFFQVQNDFTLTNFLTKAMTLFKPATNYIEENIEVTYYDFTGETLIIGGQASFARLAESIWQELITEGSIDTVYATITYPDAINGLNSPTSASSSAGMTTTSSKAIQVYPSSSLSTSSLSSSLPDIVMPSEPIDFESKYNDVSEKDSIFVLEEMSGKIVWASKACLSSINNDDISGRNIDNFIPETMFELMKKLKADPTYPLISTFIAADAGILNCRLQLSLIPSTVPALWQCTIQIDSSNTVDATPKIVELPKLRELASKSSTAIICYSTQYGLIQFANKKAQLLIGSEALQGVKIATILPFGTPTNPGEHSMPIQKKDGSLAVVPMILHPYSTITDSLVVLSFPSQISK
jgi:hypothetical protein